MKTLKVAWWKDYNNFGDWLTPFLLEKMGIKYKWAEWGDAEFLGVGSYLERVPKEYKGYVWGTGKIFEESKIDLTQAKVLAIRGKLTKEKTITDCTTFGDPGLLCKYYCPPDIEKTRDIGVIAHWNDPETKLHNMENLLIDVTGYIPDIIKQTASCKKIIASSLHGLVLADALGLPRMWVDTPANPGEGFKFHDYQSVFGDDIVPLEWYTADPNKVEEICVSLLDKLKQI
jgi:pyruvyltransferase